MLLRRIFSLLLALLLMHQGYASVDAACATHEDPAVSEHAGHAAQASGHAHAHTPGEAQSSVGSTEACAIPTQADCCQALASCAVSVGAHCARYVLGDPDLSAGQPRSVNAAAKSRSTSPEPPPPRL